VNGPGDFLSLSTVARSPRVYDRLDPRETTSPTSCTPTCGFAPGATSSPDPTESAAISLGVLSWRCTTRYRYDLFILACCVRWHCDLFSGLTLFRLRSQSRTATRARKPKARVLVLAWSADFSRSSGGVRPVAAMTLDGRLSIIRRRAGISHLKGRYLPARGSAARVLSDRWTCRRVIFFF